MTARRAMVASTARRRRGSRPTSASTGAGTMTRDPAAGATLSTAEARRRAVLRSAGDAITERASASSTTVVGAGTARVRLPGATPPPRWLGEYFRRPGQLVVLSSLGSA